MAVGDVDDEDVDAGADQLGGPLEVVAGCANRGADPQPAELVAGRERQPPLPHQILRRHQADQLAAVADERQLLDLALDHDPLGFRRIDRAGVRDEPIDRRHAVGDAEVAAADEPHVALGQQSLQPALRVDHDQRADARPRHHRPRLVDRRARRDAVRIVDDAVLRAFDDLDLAHLRLDLAGTETAVDDADAPFFRLHDRHRRARHRVHVGRHQRPLQRDPA